jgi:hypothetical protein
MEEIPEDDFVKEAYKEISDDERQKILSNARVVKALRSKSPTYGSMKIGEEDVRFRLSINKKLRRKLSIYKTRIADTNPSLKETEFILYDILSSLCPDEPWDSKETWSVYDDQADDQGAQEILLEMIKEVNSHAEDVKNFRRIP